jgi:hypothetical protein
MHLNNVKDVREFFVDELKNERFTEDKAGGKTIEMMGASFVLMNQPYLVHLMRLISMLNLHGMKVNLQTSTTFGSHILKVSHLHGNIQEISLVISTQTTA